MATPGAWVAGDPGHPEEHNRTWQRGALWLKFNATPTVVSVQQDRYVIAGTSETNPDRNRGLEHVQDGNVLQVVGDGGSFHVVATGTVESANNAIVGIYLAVARDPGAALNPGPAGPAPSDRLSESEVYVNMSGTARPTPFAVQALVDLDPGDRVYVIVQNRNGTADITVEFLHLTVVAI